MSTNRLKWVAIASFVIALGGLLLGGLATMTRLAPYPGKVVDPAGTVLFTRDDIFAGQGVYQRYGLMDHGSVWGHGSQRGMEFSAVTLHRWGQEVRGNLALALHSRPYEQLQPVERLDIDGRVVAEMKGNRYQPDADTLTLTAAQARALPTLYALWETTFGTGEPRYGFLPGTVPTDNERLAIARFFVWTAWTAVTNRPGEDYSYTNNWPPDRLVGNSPSTETYIWSLAGVLSLFVVLGLFIYFVHYYKLWYGEAQGVPLAAKLVDIPLTSSQLKAAKYFLVEIGRAHV